MSQKIHCTPTHIQTSIGIPSRPTIIPLSILSNSNFAAVSMLKVFLCWIVKHYLIEETNMRDSRVIANEKAHLYTTKTMRKRKQKPKPIIPTNITVLFIKTPINYCCKCQPIINFSNCHLEVEINGSAFQFPRWLPILTSWRGEIGITSQWKASMKQTVVANHKQNIKATGIAEIACKSR